jgi:hypothetical protein
MPLDQLLQWYFPARLTIPAVPDSSTPSPTSPTSQPTSPTSPILAAMAHVAATAGDAACFFLAQAAVGAQTREVGVAATEKKIPGKRRARGDEA